MNQMIERKQRQSGDSKKRISKKILKIGVLIIMLLSLVVLSVCRKKLSATIIRDNVLESMVAVEKIEDIEDIKYTEVVITETITENINEMNESKEENKSKELSGEGEEQVEPEQVNISVEKDESTNVEDDEEEIQEDITSANYYYYPTEEERSWAYRMAFAEAGIEDQLGQTMVVNVAINNMKALGKASLTEELCDHNRYNSYHDGNYYNGGQIVTDDIVPERVKEAVDLAFEQELTEMYLGKKALYFLNPDWVSESLRNSLESVKTFQHGHHVFFADWP